MFRLRGIYCELLDGNLQNLGLYSNKYYYVTRKLRSPWLIKINSASTKILRIPVFLHAARTGKNKASKSPPLCAGTIKQKRPARCYLLQVAVQRMPGFDARCSIIAARAMRRGRVGPPDEPRHSFSPLPLRTPARGRCLENPI